MTTAVLQLREDENNHGRGRTKARIGLTTLTPSQLTAVEMNLLHEYTALPPPRPHLLSELHLVQQNRMYGDRALSLQFQQGTANKTGCRESLACVF